MALLSINSYLKKSLSKTLFRKKNYFGRLSILGVFFVFSFFLASFKFPIIQEKLESTLLELTAPMTRGFHKIHETIFSLGEHFRNVEAFKKQKELLQNKISLLALENQEFKQQLLVYKDLENFLATKTEKKPIATVGVITSFKTPLSNYILLDGGEKIGLTKNSYVVDKNGLVGKITAVSKDYSKVQLITDPEMRIPVITETTQHHAILSGNNTNNPTLRFIFSKDPNSPLKQGDKIFTSGEGGTFHPHIFLGTLFSCSEGWCVQPSYLMQPSYVMVFPPVLEKSLENTL